MDRRDFATLATAAALGSRLHPELERLAALLPDARTAATRTRVGAADVAAIEAMNDGFRRWDLAHGGGLCRAAALSQVRQVATLDAVCAPNIRGRLHVATAERPGDALTFARLAAATATGRRHPVSPTTAGYIQAVTSWCWAMLGEPEPTRRALGESGEKYAATTPDSVPPWAWFVTDAEIAGQRGHSLHLLSLSDPRFAEAAVAELSTAVAGHPIEHERSRAVVLPTLAVAQFRAGDTASAVKTGHEAISAGTALASRRCFSRLRDLDAVAARQQPTAEVRELRSALAAALTA